MNKYSFLKVLLITLILSNCTQEPAPIINKTSAIYKPNYSETYVETPDGKIARSLRGNTDVSKAEEISIINKDKIQNTDDNSNDVKYTTVNKYYTVKSGDSLWGISKSYNISLNELAKTNNLKKPYTLHTGQKLIVGKEQKVLKSTNITTYTVKSGDNLISIAKMYNMQTIELAKINNLKKPYTLYVGQKLKIKAVENTQNNDKFYIVKNGDSLFTIASRYNMTTAQLAKLNNIQEPYSLKVGQKLILTDKNINLDNHNTQKHENIVQKPKENIKNNKELSFIWPIDGEIISSFGNKSNGLYNDGINISAKNGAEFKTTEDGVVAYVGNELRSYGTIILIKHNNNWISAYAHCGSVKVSRGDKVIKGQVIGTVGKTGSVNTPQLYFSLRNGREAVDPIKYLNKVKD